jgi:hypothetical protein
LEKNQNQCTCGNLNLKANQIEFEAIHRTWANNAAGFQDAASLSLLLRMGKEWMHDKMMILVTSHM